MSEQLLEIKYRCMRPSCCVNCREGVISLSEEYYNELSTAYEETELFRSPRGICRLGFSQPFKAVRLQKIDESAGAGSAEGQLDPADDPILVLVAEHKAILVKLDALEAQLRKRDCDALWLITKDLENDIILHSGIKEEEVLFPAINGLLLLGESLASIIKEEHREIISLLHNFRTALEIGEINDGVIDSMVVSLKGHIRKEDQEFFETLDKCLDNDLKMSIAEGMRAVEANFVRGEAGERKMDEKKAAARALFNEHILVIKETGTDTGCCH